MSLSLPVLRKLINHVLRTDAELDAFCLDYFPDIKRRFSAGMERLQKVTLLLEGVDAAEILSALRAHDRTAVEKHLAPVAQAEKPASLKDVGRALLDELRYTKVAFDGQRRRRDELAAQMIKRLGIREAPEYEMFFFAYYEQMVDVEKFVFNQIRSITDDIYKSNKKIFETLNGYPALLDAVPRLRRLKEHLHFWLQKYEGVFTRTEKMCVLYTGVEDKNGFPQGIEGEIQAWLARASSA